MTTRMQASSPGKMPLLTGLYDDGGDQAHFEDFRRRHSKQNRDIVRENANRLMLNKALQEEIVSLHRELLVVRQTTASMALKIKSLEDEMAQLRSEPSRMAIDAILTAVPALRQLQAALVPSVGLEPSEPPVPAPIITPWPEKPSLARQIQLEALTERTEAESETESEREREVASPPRRAKRRESGFIRVPSFSPELMDVVDTGRERMRDDEGEVDSIVMATVEEESEGTKSESSPKELPVARDVVSKPAVIAKPREKFTPVKKVADATASTRAKHIQDDKPAKPSKPPTGSASTSTMSSERRRVSTVRKLDSIVAIPPLEAISTAPAGRVKDRNAERPAEERARLPPAEISKRSVPPAATRNTVTPLANSMSVTANREVAVDAEGEEASTRSRTGRARKSVNYKEPSLHKKMRKPDSDEDGDSAPSTSSAGVRRKSVLPRPRMPQAAPSLPTDAPEKRRENEMVRKLLGLDDDSL